MSKKCTNWRNLFKHQTRSSWMWSAHNAKPSTPSTLTQVAFAFAPSKYQKTLSPVDFCFSCKFLLCVPRGGKGKLAVGTAWRRKGNWRLWSAAYGRSTIISNEIRSYQKQYNDGDLGSSFIYLKTVGIKLPSKYQCQFYCAMCWINDFSD